MTIDPTYPLKRIPDSFRPRFECRDDQPFAAVCTLVVPAAVAHVLPPTLVVRWAEA